MNIDKKTKKVYRLALYGLSASGKTCVLATLAMPRYPHPLGYSCLWHGIEVSDEPIKPPRLMHRSQKWMEEAINKLSQQKLPAPNPRGDDFIFEYDFTASTHQTFRIQLADYSGELINPNVSKSTLAKNLRQKFIEMDGILVLAEAPFRDGPVQKAYPDLYPLRQAFSLLRCETQDCVTLEVPLALLITKWDRYSDIDYANPAYEQSKLEEFFNSNPPPPHKGLCDVLRFSVTKGNFKVFPVSALGNTKCVQLENGNFVERPLQVNPINAFGLEDAFIWLAQQRDAIDLQKFQTQNALISKQKGLELLNRFPKDSEQAKQINTLLQESQKVKKRRTIYAIIALAAFWFAAETAIDMMNYRHHHIAVNNPHATHKQLENAEKWFTSYIAAPDFRHPISKFFLSREKAQSILTELQAQRDQLLWMPIEKALNVNLQTAFAPASEYLKYYPYGQHAQEAQDIKLRAEIQQQQQENEEAFHKIDSEVQEHSQDINKLSQLLEDLRNLPLHPQAETPEMRQWRIVLEKQLSKQLTQLKNQQEWERFYEDYDKKMQAGDFLAAAQLFENSPQNSRFNELKEIFKRKVIQAIEQKLKDEDYSKADELLKTYAKFPAELRADESKVATLQYQIYERQDEALYNAVKKHRDVNHILRYLQNAPLQRMAKEVSAYKMAYLDRIEPSVMLKLQLKLVQIRWENVNDYNNIVTVFLDGKKVISNIVDAKPNTSTGMIGIANFTAKYDELITIEITVVNKDLFFDDDYGKAEMLEKPLSELVNKFSLSLRNEYQIKTGTAFFEIEGYPKAPELPAWRSESHN